MRPRIELQQMLEDILGSRNVYFNPPTNLTMKYPAIKYSISDMYNDKANNLVYKKDKVYTLIVIDYSPDSEIVNKITDLPYATFERSYKSDNLNHFVINLYF